MTSPKRSLHPARGDDRGALLPNVPVDSAILLHVNTECVQLFLNEVSARHPNDHIVMVIDGAGWHRSAQGACQHLPAQTPPYAPELNPIEHVWDARKVLP